MKLTKTIALILLVNGHSISAMETKEKIYLEVQKPFTPSGILAKIKKCISQSQGIKQKSLASTESNFFSLPPELYFEIMDHLLQEPFTDSDIVIALESFSHVAATNKHNRTLITSEYFLKSIKKKIYSIKSDHIFVHAIRTIKKENIKMLPAFQADLAYVMKAIHIIRERKTSNNPADLVNTAQEYISNGINPDLLVCGDSLLHTAVRRENISLIEYLIKAGANVNNVNFNGETPLYTAIKLGSSLIALDLLKKYNANTHLPTNPPWSPKSYDIVPIRVDNQTNKLFKILVKKGLDPNSIITLGYCTPGYSQQPLLVFPIETSDFETAQFLLKHGADPQQSYNPFPSFKDENFTTPLIEAEKLNNPEMLSLLKKYSH